MVSRISIPYSQFENFDNEAHKKDKNPPQALDFIKSPSLFSG